MNGTETREITNSEDIIDSRDIIARIATLTDWVEMELADDDETAELETLGAFARECEDYCEDWQYGATLIRDSYYEDYARELAEDIGAVPSEYTWPTSCIDWAQAARDLQMDYSAVDFAGVTYWVR